MHDTFPDRLVLEVLPDKLYAHQHGRTPGAGFNSLLELFRAHFHAGSLALFTAHSFALNLMPGIRGPRGRALRALEACYGTQMDRSMLEEYLRQARAHVERGKEHVIRQRALVEELERDGHDTTMARLLLRTFEETEGMLLADVEQRVKDLAAFDKRARV
jgi:hypothetical protein